MAALGLLASLAAHRQPPRGRFRIGVLAIGTPEGATAVTDAFNQAMRELGYVEGTNVVYENLLGTWCTRPPAGLRRRARSNGSIPVIDCRHRKRARRGPGATRHRHP